MPTDNWCRALGLSLVIAGTASPLCAQDPRLSARLPGALALEVQGLADSAAALGLPAEPLVLKALEGESKGADPARILSAVRQLAGRLAIGRRELGPGSTEPELVAAAAALRAGAAPAALRTLRGLRPGKLLVVPLSVLADLLGAGVPANEAWRSVEEVAATGGADAAFLQLRERLAGSVPPPNLPPRPERAPGPGSDPGSSRP